MRSGFKVSIGSLMLYVILVALQLVLFQGVWQILLVPPITIVVLTLNLGLFFLLVRPPALEPRIAGMLLGGLAAFVTIMMTLVSDGPNLRWAIPYRRGRLGPMGQIGKLVDDALFRWLTSLPDPKSPTAMVLGFISDNIFIIEMISLNLLGVALICAGGWLERQLRGRWVRARAPGLTGLPPLDDRAATPL
jgi:hypothetical protein